ncbi:hypothetical protein Q5Y75_22935 [Ruegeria sp. 2205SS24-7]|uniref:hypothetical protein n=1 Tax=Ruegeria discodermiae TaxID=3064389 RepID=UPI0027407D0F|nr:hypothetical protein [Ruegeria sp. 2205SS24-7]MDP5220064.1 hypothetical protein [Ruegeria sp. 2205SS24-7]
MSEDLLVKALEMLKTGGLKPGPKLDRAHEICQDHEGELAFDWIHALVHRIEGDDGNADYWYRRAGKTRYPGSISDEWQAIWADLSKPG